MTERGTSNSLPPGWAWTTLGDICLRITKGSTPTSYGYVYADEGVRFIRTEDIMPDGRVADDGRCITEEAHDFLARSVLAPDDILFSIAGTIGRVGVVHPNDLPANTNQALAIVRGVWNETDRDYAFHYLKSPVIQRQAVSTVVGVGRANISLQDVGSFPVPLPPLPEQRRIVAKIEELFSQLDAGVEELKKAKSQLKRYRQAVLKAAFVGKLTEEWRKQNLTTKTPRNKEGKKPETAQELLARIREERKKALGTKYKEPPPLDTSELPELPEGWAWTRLDALAAYEPHAITDGPFGSNLKTSHYTESGPRVIRLQNIGDGAFVDAFAHISQAHYEELARHKVLAGDLVIAALGEELPRSCVIPPSVGPAIVKADCVRFKPNGIATSAQFLNVVLNAEPLKRMVSDIIHGVGRPRLNQQQVRALPVPLPPVAEQKTIVLEVEERLSVADAEEKAIEAALAQAARLRQSILKRAFEGRLVPQDPSDEPADRLLERIRQARANSQVGKRPRANRQVAKSQVGKRAGI